MSRNLQTLGARGAEGQTLFEALTAAADGGATAAQVEALAAARRYPAPPLLGAASFYDFLRPDHRGKRAFLCKGTSCLHADAERERARAALAARYAPHEVGEMACVGHCYRGGGLVAEGRSLDAGCLDQLGDPAEAAPIPFFPAAAERVLSEPVGDPDAFYAALPTDPARILAAAAASGLRGRGGAGFPFALKLKACAEAPAGQKYVVCNADEGDPGAFSDRWLLEYQPHRVLAGLWSAALACGADQGLLYLRAEYPEAQRAVAAAIAEFEASPAVRATGFRLRVVPGAGAYVCGEETALLNSIEGRRPEVRVRPPFPAQAGLFGRPTLLSNVETFAALPWILTRGGAAFAAIGTARSSGTKLVCLDHTFVRPGVYEVPMGLPCDTLIHELAGGYRTAPKALQVGGPLGGVVPTALTGRLTLDFESFQREGFLLGHAGVVGIPRSVPMLDFLTHLFGYMADESCGKCVPCRLGTRSGHRMLQAAAAGTPIDRAAFADLLDTLAAGSLCALGGGLPLPVRNVLDHFPDELAACWSRP